MNSVYSYVTENIIKQLEKGVVPWRKPWIHRGVINYVTRKPYRGINLLLLQKPGEYLTFLQCQALGGKIKKGAKSEMVVFYKQVEKPVKDSEEDENKSYRMLRYYNVFHIDDCEGIESKLVEEIVDNESIPDAESVIEGYEDCPQIKFEGNKAYYSPALDIISAPPITDYKNPEAYYSTMYHEMMHSTGSKCRLNRKGVADFDKFGSHQYSYEELIAEIGAAMLCSHVKLETTLDNSAAYVGSWIKKLNNDKTMIVKAASEAQKAVEYILGEQEA